jgi:hypothetical protein
MLDARILPSLGKWQTGHPTRLETPRTFQKRFRQSHPPVTACGMEVVSYFLYTDIPHAGKGWTLAVLAISRRDADNYMRALHHGGRHVSTVKKGGSVNANCGAITAAAQNKLSQS